MLLILVMQASDGKVYRHTASLDAAHLENESISYIYMHIYNRSFEQIGGKECKSTNHHTTLGLR